MHIVSNRDNFHEKAKPILWEKIRKNILNCRLLKRLIIRRQTDIILIFAQKTGSEFSFKMIFDDLHEMKKHVYVKNKKQKNMSWICPPLN